MATQQEIVSLVIETLKKKDLSQNAVQVINRAAEKVLRRVQQDFTSSIKESSEATIEDFCRKLATRLGVMSQNWYDGAKNEVVIYPEGTRFIHQSGDLSVVVIEQSPQLRTVNVGKNNYHLAFPYTVFVVPFLNHKWTGEVNVAFRNAPITSLDDNLFEVAMPNMKTSTIVCMGSFKLPDNLNLTQQVNGVIAGWWQSNFNYDGGNQNLEAFMSANNLCQDIDTTTGLNKGFSNWQAFSKADGLWGTHARLKTVSGDGYSTLRGLVDYIETRFAGTSNKGDIIKQLKQEIITAVGTIGAEIQKAILDVDILKQNKQKVNIETLDEVLKEIIALAYSELWQYMNAQLVKERNKLASEYSSSSTKVSPVWGRNVE